MKIFYTTCKQIHCPKNHTSRTPINDPLTHKNSHKPKLTFIYHPTLKVWNQPQLRIRPRLCRVSAIRRDKAPTHRPPVRIYVAIDHRRMLYADSISGRSRIIAAASCAARAKRKSLAIAELAAQGPAAALGAEPASVFFRTSPWWIVRGSAAFDPWSSKQFFWRSAVIERRGYLWVDRELWDTAK